MTMMGRRPFLQGISGLGIMLGPASLRAEDVDLLGTWTGVLRVGSQNLRLCFSISSAEAASLQSLDQGGQPIPARVTALTAENIAIDVPAVRGAFTGHLVSADRIEGTWRQGAELPLTLMRGEAGLAAGTPAIAPLTQARLAELRKEAESPALAAACERRGGARHFWVAGERAIGSAVAPTDADLWHLGSITKSMTATLVARLVEAGALRFENTLGDLLGDVVKEMRDEYRAANFRHLLSHRSGLPGNIPMPDLLGFSREIADAREERLAYARIALAMPPKGPLAATFEYANNGYVVAGSMLEHKLGQSWEALVKRHVFAPLGLDSAGFGAPGRKGALEEPVGHAPGPGGALRAFPVGEGVSDNPVVIGPAGRVHMSLADLLTYLAAHRDRSPFLAESGWRQLHTPPFGGNYAMGWFVRPDGSLWHNGSNTLWYAEARVDAAQGVVAAAATNDGNLQKSSSEVGEALLAASAAA
jgi:CubicO group peptidase (beta-lactamase class C family)